jgi:hypothetical protein
MNTSYIDKICTQFVLPETYCSAYVDDDDDDDNACILFV